MSRLYLALLSISCALMLSFASHGGVMLVSHEVPASTDSER